MANNPDKTLLENVRGNIEDEFIQMILLNEKAFIVESCNTLFDTDDLLGQPATSWSPFIESMFDYLITVPTGTPEILFPRVEMPLKALQGFYDFAFVPIKIENHKYILWTIYDYTSLYAELQRNQQRMNELEIHRQKLNNQINHIVQKNLSLYKKRKKNASKNSLLLQANNILLTQVFTHLEEITDTTKDQEAEDLLNSFSLYKLLSELEYGLNAVQTYSVEVKANVKKTLRLIGDKSQLLYIFYDLLSISNHPSTNVSTVEINNIPTAEPAISILMIDIYNTRLTPVDTHNQFLTKEFSQLLSPAHALQIETIKKLIIGQSGKFKWIDFSSEGAHFQLTLPFRTV